MGKIKGPNVSSREVKLQAGWNGDSPWPGAIRAAPSEADRPLACPLPRPVWLLLVLKLIEGERRGLWWYWSPSSNGFGEIGSDAPFLAQYSSRISVCFRLTASLL